MEEDAALKVRVAVRERRQEGALQKAEEAVRREELEQADASVDWSPSGSEGSKESENVAWGVLSVGNYQNTKLITYYPRRQSVRVC